MPSMKFIFVTLLVTRPSESNPRHNRTFRRSQLEGDPPSVLNAACTKFFIPAGVYGSGEGGGSWS